MGPTWGPPGSYRPQMGPMLAPWILLSGTASLGIFRHYGYTDFGGKYLNNPGSPGTSLQHKGFVLLMMMIFLERFSRNFVRQSEKFRLDFFPPDLSFDDFGPRASSYFEDCGTTLRWRHNGRDSVSNHQPHNRLFRRRSKETSSSASLAFVWGIHRGPVNSPHIWPVTRKMLPFDNVIMSFLNRIWLQLHKCATCVTWDRLNKYYTYCTNTLTDLPYGPLQPLIWLSTRKRKWNGFSESYSVTSQ